MFIALFCVLLAIRGLSELLCPPESRWCESFTSSVLFYFIAIAIGLLLPKSIEDWGNKAGRLTALMIFFVILGSDISGGACRNIEIYKVRPHVLLTSALAAGFTAWVVSRLVAMIRARERHIRLMASGLTEALWTVDCRTGEAVLSESFGRAFGYEPGEVASSIDGWATITHPEDKDRVVESFNAAANGFGTFWQENYRVRRSDGSYASVCDKCRFERDADGVAVFAYGGVLDISAQIDAENRLKQLNEELESRAQDRARELTRVIFAVTHDLKSPLSSVMGYAEMALMRDAAQNDPATRNDLANILRSADRMQAFLSGLLAHPREQAAEPKSSKLSAVFEELENEFAPDLAAVDGMIVHDSPGVEVLCSHYSLHRVLQNLIGNSIKYRRTGTPPVITLSTRTENGVAVIRVKDNAKGITPGELPRIFDMHYRAAGDFTTEGQGIGLASAKAIIVRHKGDLTAESREGEGSVFTLTIPLAR